MVESRPYQPTPQKCIYFSAVHDSRIIVKKAFGNVTADDKDKTGRVMWMFRLICCSPLRWNEQLMLARQ